MQRQAFEDLIGDIAVASKSNPDKIELLVLDGPDGGAIVDVVAGGKQLFCVDGRNARSSSLSETSCSRGKRHSWFTS